MAQPGIVFLMYHELELPRRPLCQSGPGYVRYILSQESFRSQMLRQLHALGFEIGCHSMTHAYLDDLEQPVLRREIFDAGKKLEDIIGRKIEHFSCPGGRYDDRTRDLAREARYRSLATSRAHANTSATDSYSLGRVAILRDTDTVTFDRVCAAEALWQIRVGETLRGAAKRAMGNTMYDRFRSFLLRQP